MAGIRSFVAVGLPDDHRRALAAHLESCARLAPGYRWVGPGSLHLTLRFLGHLEAPALERVRVELEGVRAAPFRLSLGGAGAFGSRSAPRVVWLRIAEGIQECRTLAEAVEAACRSAGVDPVEKGFRAHVTIGRQRSEGMRLPDLPEPPALAAWTVDAFVLYESRLGGGPARYVPLEHYQLRPE